MQQFASTLPELPDTVAELKSLLRQIPRGRVATFGQIAKALGDVKAAKWVASWLIAEPPTDDCPTQRVVRVDGSLGEYRLRSAADQAVMLTDEGVRVAGNRVDLAEFGFAAFQSTLPLQRLSEWQSDLAPRISLEVRPELRQLFSERTWPDAGPQPDESQFQVAGVDVSYVSPTHAVAAYVLVDVITGALTWSMTRAQAVVFPYISGYLAFRELPVLLPLLDEVRAAGKLADVVLVDGHGILHPRRMGIASHLGVLTGLATIGVGKTLSVGAVDLRNIQPGESRPIIEAGQAIGTALRPPKSSRPLFYSPGHRMDLATADWIVGRLTQQFRLPAPTYWADRLSREAARKLG